MTKPFIYSNLNGLNTILGDGFIVFDCAVPLEHQLAALSDMPATPRWDVPVVGVEGPLEGLLDEGKTFPEDSQGAALLYYWALSRCSMMVAALDGVVPPEIQLASMAGIPILGVTMRHVQHPVVHSVLAATVAPNQGVIRALVNALVLSVSVRSDSEGTV